MEPKNCLIEKENHLKQTSFFGFHADFSGCKSQDTLPKFNMELEKDAFQKESPIPGCHFQVPC